MKTILSRTILAIGLFSGISTSSFGVVTYHTTFDSYVNGPLHGQDGWSASAFLTSVLPGGLGTGKVGAIGGTFAPGVGVASHSATGALVSTASTPEAPNGTASEFSADFGIFASGETDSFSFNFNFNSDFLSIDLIPNAGSWDVSWRTSSGSNATSVSVSNMTTTPLSVRFEPSGADVVFTAEVGSSSFTGTLSGLAGANWTSFSIGSESGSTPGGDSLRFDNINLRDVAVVVPEPATLGFAGLALGGLLFRRRRN